MREIFHALKYRLLLASLVVAAVFVATKCRGQDRFYGYEATVNLGEPPAEFVTGWRTFPPVREFNEPSAAEILCDIESHLTAAQSLRSKYPDVLTWAHEDCHRVNELLGKQCGPGLWAFYCLSDRGAVFRFPKISKRLVEQNVPAELRGPLYQHYMTGMNPELPLVILDEWVAFINTGALTQEMYGSAKRVSKGTDANGVTTHSLLKEAEFALEFAGYATVLLQCIDRFEPDYPDRDKLAQFIGWNLARTLALTKLDPQPEKVQLFTRRYYTQCQDGQCSPVPQWSGSQWTGPAIQQQMPRMAPVQPTAPLPKLIQPKRPKPINGNQAVELTPARPLTPIGKADQIQDVKAAIDQLSKAVAKIDERLDVLEAPNLVAVPDCKCDKSSPCNCDPDKIAAAVLAKIKLPSPVQPSAEKHAVVIANQDADTWPRLKGEIELAQKSYSGIRIAPVPDFPVGVLPKMVIYENRIPTKVISGQRDVESALARLRRGEIDKL